MPKKLQNLGEHVQEGILWVFHGEECVEYKQSLSWNTHPSDGTKGSIVYGQGGGDHPGM